MPDPVEALGRERRGIRQGKPPAIAGDQGQGDPVVVRQRVFVFKPIAVPALARDHDAETIGVPFKAGEIYLRLGRPVSDQAHGGGICD